MQTVFLITENGEISKYLQNSSIDMRLKFDVRKVEMALFMVLSINC